MEIDIRTITLILGTTHLLQVLVFYYQYLLNKSIKGPGWWLAWSAAETLAFVFILLRGVPSLLPYMIVLQNTAMLSGTLFLYIGILKFFDKKINLKFILSFFLLFLFIHLYFIFVNNDISIRSLNIAAFLSIIAFITAFSLNKYKYESIALTANFNTAIFILYGSIFSYRAIMIGTGTQVTDVFAASLFNYLPYFAALIVSLLWTFGFIMMVNQRLNSGISEAKTHFELIFNTSPDAMVISRISDGHFVDCNENFLRLTGYTREEISADSPIRINIWQNPDDRITMIRMVKSKGICENFESNFVRKNGTVVTGLMSAQKLVLKGVPHLITLTRDITERKQIEEEIKLKNEELHQLNAEKDKFFSIIAHDLRSPFSGFLGLTEFLVENLPQMTLAKVRQIATQMSESATNIFRLIENLLEWARMEQGTIPINPVLVHLLPMLEESLAIVAAPAKEKSIRIEYDIADNLEIFADKNILQTVTRNLVSNAVKFTPHNGKITLSTKHNPGKSVEISVSDSGIGMNAELVEKLFKIDIQTKRPGTDKESGTGLGLILCKMLIEKHGGKIWVESEEGKGSVFRFTIPNYFNTIEKSTPL